METTVEHGHLIRANGIDIHYLERGAGRPLLLLHGGLVSSSLRWAGVPVSYASHLDTLASRFRVIAPDTRGCARTAHTGDGTISFALLADDVAALIDALGLERPLVAGFSEGAITATILAHPQARVGLGARQPRRPRLLQPAGEELPDHAATVRRKRRRRPDRP